jgi:hypothetical protein
VLDGKHVELGPDINNVAAFHVDQEAPDAPVGDAMGSQEDGEHA